MQTARSFNTIQISKFTIKDLIIALVFGVIAASVCLAFAFLVNQSELLRHEFPWITLFLPLGLALSIFIKQKTLYFPQKVKDLHEMTDPNPALWNPWMSIYHFGLASLSHLFGASVGREGVIVLVTSGLVERFSLKLSQWGPVATGIAFSAITGNKWVGAVLVVELFSTQLQQKVYTFIGSWCAVLVLQSFKFPHLFIDMNFQDSESVVKRFVFIFILALVMGSISRIYKTSYLTLSHFFKKKSKVWTALVIICISILLYQEPFRSFQSLSLEAQSRFASGSFLYPTDFSWVMVKLALTILCVSIGFFGGEFVPLVVIGTGLSALIAQYYGEQIFFGLALGGYALFAGISRLKWTSIVLTLGLMGFGQFIWIYLFFSILLFFADAQSLYLKEQ